MAELFLDIRDRYIRAIVSDSGETRFQRSYALQAIEYDSRTNSEQLNEQPALREGELTEIIATIRTDAGISFEQAHLLLPCADVQLDIHRLPRMPQQDAYKLLLRKTVEKTGDESPQISLIPMAIDQNSQEWLVEYIPSDTIKDYKKEFTGARLKLKTVTTSLDSTLHAISHIRESIFNAHAVFEINDNSIEAYYVSSSSLLLYETLPINDDEDIKNHLDTERAQKRRMFTILDRLYRINTQYMTAHPMTPLQKVWLCGTDTAITDLSKALQEAMDVEVDLLSPDEDAYVALKGFWKAYQGGLVFNFMHSDLLNRFPLRKKTGLLIYIVTVLLVVFFVVTTEFRHSKLKKQAFEEKKALTALKLSQTKSGSFTKDLDLLRKLSGNQLMLYPILRELSSNLPDGIYLDSFSYSGKDNHDTIDISATFIQSSDLGTKKTLTSLMEIMNHSPYLKHYREPSVISNTKELKKTMTVKFTCEVTPLESAK
jgi:hypothetical protein